MRNLGDVPVSAACSLRKTGGREAYQPRGWASKAVISRGEMRKKGLYEPVLNAGEPTVSTQD